MCFPLCSQVLKTSQNMKALCQKFQFLCNVGPIYNWIFDDSAVLLGKDYEQQRDHTEVSNCGDAVFLQYQVHSPFKHGHGRVK